MKPSRPVRAGALALLLGLVACQSRASPGAQDSLYPMELGSRWVYDTSFYGPTPRSATTTTAVCRLRDTPDGDRVYLVSTCVGDEVVQAELIVQRGAEIARPVVFDAQGEAAPREPPEVVARTDLSVGQAWTWEGQVAGSERTTRYRVTNKGHVITPAGEYDGFRLLATDESGGPPAAVERWYVPGIGLVKEAGAVVYPSENGVSLVELVRVLREHDVAPVGSISCCAELPADEGG